MPGLRRMLDRLNRSDEELLAEELRAWSATLPGVSAISEVTPRSRARVAGQVRRITIRPQKGADALELLLYDGSGELSVVWLGRRTIPGLSLESRLIVDGMVGEEAGTRRMVNPAFEFAGPSD